jgi:hypothetical protein
VLLLHLLLALLPAHATLLLHHLQGQLPILPTTTTTTWLAGAGALDRQLTRACLHAHTEGVMRG